MTSFLFLLIIFSILLLINGVLFLEEIVKPKKEVLHKEVERPLASKQFSRSGSPSSFFLTAGYYLSSTLVLILLLVSYFLESKGLVMKRDDHGSSPSTSGKTHEKTSVIQTRR